MCRYGRRSTFKKICILYEFQMCATVRINMHGLYQVMCYAEGLGC